MIAIDILKSIKPYILTFSVGLIVGFLLCMRLSGPIQNYVKKSDEDNSRLFQEVVTERDNLQDQVDQLVTIIHHHKGNAIIESPHTH